MISVKAAITGLITLAASLQGTDHATAPVKLGSAASVALPVPFNVGERFDYEVRFGPLKVGDGHMEVTARETIRGRDAWHTAFWVHGGTFFYQVNDVLESWIDVQTFSSLRFIQQLEEGSQDRERHFEIYPDRGYFVESKTVKGKLKTGNQEKTVENPLDDGSFLFFIRTIPLKVGETYSFNRYFRPDRNPVRVRVLRKERITVPAGTFDAIVLQPVIKTKGIFSEDGRAEIWLSDDERRIMLQLKSKLSFGSLNLHLRSFYIPPANQTTK
ncbi:MAG: DUF3108 domain-containing protein [Gemmatimonadaceae bacterium]|nr:DUF3108 domain-containing protein [Gemmatimonadaceae bacterium]